MTRRVLAIRSHPLRLPASLADSSPSFDRLRACPGPRLRKGKLAGDEEQGSTGAAAFSFSSPLVEEVAAQADGRGARPHPSPGFRNDTHPNTGFPEISSEIVRDRAMPASHWPPGQKPGGPGVCGLCRCHGSPPQLRDECPGQALTLSLWERGQGSVQGSAKTRPASLEEH